MNLIVSCVWSIFKVPTDCGVEAARRTHATRRWSSRKSFTQITTWRGGGGSKWPTPCAWQSARSKFGFKTDAWSSRRRFRPSRSSTNRTKRRIPKAAASAPIRPTHPRRPTEEIENKMKKKTQKNKQTTTAKSNHLSYSYSQIFFNFFLLISLYKKNMFFVYILSSIPNLPHTSLKFATQPKLLFSFLSFWNHQTQIHSSQCIIKPFKGKLALSCLSLKTIIIHSLSLEIYFIRIKCTSVVVVAQKQKDKNFTFYFVHVQHEIWKKEKKMKIENHVRVRARPWYLRENETRTKNSMYTYSTNIFFFCFSIQFTLHHVAGIQKEMKENTLFCSYSYTISVYNYIRTSVALNTWGFSLWKIVTLDVATYFLK